MKAQDWMQEGFGNRVSFSLNILPCRSPTLASGVDEDEGADASAGAEGTEYEAMTVPKLRQVLKQRRLKTGGNKSELVKRLEEYDNDTSSTAPLHEGDDGGTSASNFGRFKMRTVHDCPLLEVRHGCTGASPPTPHHAQPKPI